MKQLKLAVMALLMSLTFSNINAQDENNPWVVGFGINAVDFYEGTDFSDHLKDWFGSSDWNVLPSISRISVDKYLNKGFTLQLAGSLNKIKTLSTKNDSDFVYYSIDAIVKYDLNNLFGQTGWFDPYVFGGGSYVSAKGDGEGMLNGGLGFNAWINDNLGLNFHHGTKLGFSDNVTTHYQTSLGLVFRFGGKDADNDGIFDKDDACPEVAGIPELKGCPDSDGDGIKDSDDACPNVVGLATMNGCPDADEDGVTDNDDMCPNSKGTKANKGCPDTDGDGVVDKNDRCVTVAGSADNGGCPWSDTDGDGVADKDDKCKTEAGPASNNGCPESVISEDAKLKIIEMAKTIYFNTGSNSLKSGVTNQLGAIASIMNSNPKATFVIEGHTDSTGRSSSNLRLSERRANAVMNYLVTKGNVSGSRLTAKGFGEDYPKDTNKTRAGRANNRRVEIKVTN